MTYLNLVKFENSNKYMKVWNKNKNRNLSFRYLKSSHRFHYWMKYLIGRFQANLIFKANVKLKLLEEYITDMDKI